MLSMKARYAIRALTALAVHPPDRTVLVADIAESERIPRRFLEGILQELRQRGMVRSRKGRGGGYSLLQSAEEITVEAVLVALDGPIASKPCFNNQTCRSCKECPDFVACGACFVLERVNTSIRTALQGLTIADLSRHLASRPPASATSASAGALLRGVPRPTH